MIKLGVLLPLATTACAAQTEQPLTIVSGKPSASPRALRYAEAAGVLAGRPGTMGIIVWDRQSNTFWREGDTAHPTWTASTVKLAIVTSLLEQARTHKITLSGADHQDVAAVLDVSDDNAATRLWNKCGKDKLVPRFRQAYGMTGLTFVDGFPRFWGHMKCTAEDLMRLMAYVLEKVNPQDREFLLDRMRHVGAIQQWGAWAAGPSQQPGVKNGWSIEPDGGQKHWVANTVGFAGPGARYAIAAMYDLPAGKTIDDGVHAVSDVIATIFGQVVPAKVTVPDPSTGL